MIESEVKQLGNATYLCPFVPPIRTQHTHGSGFPFPSVYVTQDASEPPLQLPRLDSDLPPLVYIVARDGIHPVVYHDDDVVRGSGKVGKRRLR